MLDKKDTFFLNQLTYRKFNTTSMLTKRNPVTMMLHDVKCYFENTFTELKTLMFS